MTQADMPTNASIVTTPTNLIITGKHLNNRTCSLRGVVTFQSMRKSAQAQLDPNLRDPSTTPLCFPMATQIFIAGVVKDNNSTIITRHVAVQIEPHGRLRVVGEEPQDINVRLDGISYAPWMPFNTPPSDCVGYCFPKVSTDKAGRTMGVSGCTKYCTPNQYETVAGDTGTGRILSKQVDCRCDVMKRIECFKREGETMLTCGQYKELVRMHSLDSGKDVGFDVCGEICARQLSLM